MSGKDWKFDESCEARVYFEKLNIPGCKVRRIRNRFCYGICNSIIIPGIFMDCKACLPEKIHKRTIYLTCKIDGVWKKVPREYEVVKRCSCADISCEFES